MPPSKILPPGFYHYPPGRGELPIPLKQHFLKILFPQQKEGGEDYVVEIITKIKKGISRKF